ncbi:PepSY domain-containing protein [Erythrobacter sp. SCSIO 43205]|uniref:PepSY domain-containing protein n=1 Tax=Erythrobacter sp. SCSIO 43205 TaxID=2779361 RepID=UPI001CAA1F58|nr:PepSY domain-containing protein [Erythrobacter sp. SCSIO 43205]UAB77452.1 PepSY domain-containing protein [Erythrobacter sp. SCSIO 43205]
MAKNSNMRLFAKWHIWLGWLVGVPIVMWLASGLFMTIKPIDEVRGDHLRVAVEDAPLVVADSEFANSADAGLKEMRLVMQEGRAVALLTTLDGTVTRIDYASGEPIAPVTAEKARAIVAQHIVGGNKVTSVRFFEADEVPFDFRRPRPVWQVTLEDATHVYVGRDTGEIEAVRTQWWRWFDFMWGLHIMDLSEREATSHPILILFAGLSLIGAILGCILMFRRRKSRIKALAP